MMNKVILCFLTLMTFVLFSACENSTNAPERVSSDTLAIGVILPETGSGPLQGAPEKVAVKLALEDVNELFASDEDIAIKAVIKDSKYDPFEILAAFDEFVKNNIKIVVFAGKSENLVAVSDYIEEKGLLVITPTCTLTDLAKEDNIYRLVPGDHFQAKSTAQVLRNEGMEKLLILKAGNIWGNGLAFGLMEEFNKEGGSCENVMDYYPEFLPKDVEETLVEADALVGKMLESTDSSKVAISSICYEEGVEIMKMASDYANLGKVKWYGSDGFVQNKELFSVPEATEFAAKVGMKCPIISELKSEMFQSVKSRISEIIGYPAYSWSVLLYDGVKLAALTRLNDEYNPDITSVKNVFANVLKEYDAVSGSIELDENGDRKEYSFDYWEVRKQAGKYSWENMFSWPK